MPGARRVRRGMAKGSRRSAETGNGPGRDGGGPDRYDGRANLAAGSRGKEPGGRWAPAYYESAEKVIGEK